MRKPERRNSQVPRQPRSRAALFPGRKVLRKVRFRKFIYQKADIGFSDTWRNPDEGYGKVAEPKARRDLSDSLRAL
ncbi:hypothetical protein [Mesorhizobium captivum]|uniref:hypothetical protein n=1 Tax=Mesorhizobium captivum TaxID=3072319 RepID=UPI002A24D4CC|nr:hypothetical protein [Mesorhizobium sp. VK23E]MDX8510837.1 hypothetical protein [Mesorhizobium sp. VK23E]